MGKIAQATAALALIDAEGLSLQGLTNRHYEIISAYKGHAGSLIDWKVWTFPDGSLLSFDTFTNSWAVDARTSDYSNQATKFGFADYHDHYPSNPADKDDTK